MKLVAAMNVRNELHRWLPITVPHLLEWVDAIAVQDDGSTDGSAEWLEAIEGVELTRTGGNLWAEHEGNLHARLFEHALTLEPTHVLAIDADEIVPEGKRLRRLLELDEQAGTPEITYTLNMVELWGTDPPVARHDGGWRPHPVAILYRLPEGPRGREWRIDGRKLASPRVPRAVVTELRRGRHVEQSIDVLHLGWARPEEREARHRRYVELDGGRYHAKRHLESIMWPDERCDLRPYEGPMPALP